MRRSCFLTLLLFGLSLFPWAAFPPVSFGQTKEPASTARQLPPQTEAQRAKQEESRAKIRKALDARRDFDLVDRPFEELLDELRRDLKISIHVDKKALEDEAIDPAFKVSFKAKDLAVYSALSLILRPMLLAYEVREDGLWITTQTHTDTPFSNYKEILSFLEAQIAPQAESQAKIREALATRRDFDLVDRPFQELLDEFRRELKIPIHFDKKGLEDDAIDPAFKVSLKAKDLAVDSALELMLRPKLMTHVVREDGLWITTWTAAEDTLETRVHAVADLVLMNPEDEADYQSLIDLITSVVHPDTWDTVGGRGSVREFQAPGIESLVLSQTAMVQDEVEVLLAGLRRARRGGKGKSPPEPKWIERLLERRAAGEAAMRKVLDTQVQLPKGELSLREFAEELRRDLKVNVWIDVEALEDEALTPDLRLDFQGEIVTARTAFQKYLKPKTLAAVFQHDVLRITTKTLAEDTLETRIYDVADLVLTDLDMPDGEADFEMLLGVVGTAVDPDTWDTVGGRGAAREFRAAGLDLLVVSQTQENHEAVEQLLAKLRASRQGDARRRSKRLTEPQGGWDGLGSEAGVEPLPPSGPLPPDEDRDALQRPLKKWAAELYRQAVAEGKGNQMVSPYSAAQALGMLAAGADGETAREIEQALGWELPNARLHPAMAALAQQLPIGSFQGEQLRLANRLWTLRDDRPMSGDFIRTLDMHYQTSAASVDFADAATCDAINQWVQEQTAGMIGDLFLPGSFDDDTRMVLANALYFQGFWKTPFSESSTRVEPFHAVGRKVQAPMMTLEDFSARYVQLDGLERLTKDYQGSLSMTVLLPAADREFTEFEKSLTGENLEKWMKEPGKPHVKIQLPKFEFTSAFDMEKLLKGLGVRRAFLLEKADFRRMGRDDGLYLQAWRHNTRIEVDELGTTAAAVTGGSGAGGGFDTVKVPTFRADRPFVFLIHDRRTQAILFLGRVMDPTAKGM